MILLWFYAMFIQIKFGSSMRSYASHRHRRESGGLFTYLWIQYKKKNLKEKKYILEVLIHLSLWNNLKCRGEWSMKTSFLLFDSAKIFLCVVYTHTRSKTIKYLLRCAIVLWKLLVCKNSIRFQVIKLKLLCETLKNEKWKILAWYPNKCGDITNKILNAVTDAEQTFKCKWL